MKINPYLILHLLYCWIFQRSYCSSLNSTSTLFKMTLSKIIINNFRSFNRELKLYFLVWEVFSVLTGPNNSGKSSVFKLVSLLKENFRQNIHHSSEFENLTFKGRSRKLGGFKDILPNKDTSKVLEITFPFYPGELRLFYMANEIDNSQGKLMGLRWLSYFDAESSDEVEIVFLELKIVNEGYIANINFEAIRKLIDEKRKLEIKNDEGLKKYFGGKTPKEILNPQKVEYDPDLPIYNLELFSKNLGIIDSEAALRRILNHVSYFDVRFQDSDFHAPILPELLDKIKKLYVPINISIENIQFTKDDQLSILPLENGYAFFQEVANLIDDNFNSFFDKFDGIRHINNDRRIENRVFLLNEDTVLNQSILNYISKPNQYDFNFLNESLKKFNVLKNDERVKINHLSKSAAEIVFVSSMEQEENGTCRNLLDEGYGVVQLFTILLSLSEKSSYRTIFIEEPEINLHPNFPKFTCRSICRICKQWKEYVNN